MPLNASITLDGNTQPAAAVPVLFNVSITLFVILLQSVTTTTD